MEQAAVLHLTNKAKIIGMVTTVNDGFVYTVQFSPIQNIINNVNKKSHSNYEKSVQEEIQKTIKTCRARTPSCTIYGWT